MSEVERDRLYPPATEPDFAAYDRYRGTHVHDWRTHVGPNTRALWDSFTDEQKRAIALDAEILAGQEEWD